MLERINGATRHHTKVNRTCATEARVFRLVRALTVETHEPWSEANRNINIDRPKEHQKGVV